MRIRLLVLFLGLFCAAGTAGAQGSPENYHLEAGIMFWKPSPDVAISSGSLGTPIDFINQFAIKDKRLRQLRLVLKPGRKHKIRFSTVPIEYSGSATLNQTIRFNGVTYTVGVPTEAELKWTLMRFGYEWDPIATDMGYVGIFTDLKYNKMKASLTAPSPIGVHTFERNVPVPTIGVSGRGYLTQFVSVTAEFTAFKFDNSSFNAKFYDLDIYGTANFGRNVGVEFGYRSITADYIVDDDTGDLKIKGPYFGGVVRF